MSEGETIPVAQETPATTAVTVSTVKVPAKPSRKAGTVKSAANAKESVKAKAKTKETAAKPKADVIKHQAKIRQVADLCKVAGDPIRACLLLTLTDRPKHLKTLHSEFTLMKPALGYHLGMLRHGSLISQSRDGQQAVYELTESGQSMAQVCQGLIEE